MIKRFMLHNFNLPKTIAIYSDHYVEILRKYCDGDLRVLGKVYWFDEGGLRTQWLRVLDADMLELKPDVVFISVGGNDITLTLEPREMYDRIQKTVLDLEQAGTRDVNRRNNDSRRFFRPIDGQDYIWPPTPKNQ